MACNPADWMLRISEPKSEDAIGVDFADIFGRSSACRHFCLPPSIVCTSMTRDRQYPQSPVLGRQ